MRFFWENGNEEAKQTTAASRQHRILTRLPRRLSSLDEVNPVRFNDASDATFD